MHETETFERVKQDRADAADKRLAQVQSDSHLAGNGTGTVTGNTELAGQYGSTQTTDIRAATSPNEIIGSSSRMEELKRTWHFYKYHMLGMYVRALHRNFPVNHLFLLVS